MHYVTDLHLHSKYSRAVSPQMTLPVMAQVARQKGLDVLSASDFTHPVWFKEISEQLEEAEEGLYTLKFEYQNPKSETNANFQNINEQKQIRFMLSTEISSIYKQGDRVRRIHNLVFVPSLEVAEKFNKALIKRGANLTADGRPIVGLSARDLLELLLSIDERAFIIPAHIWTPHFGVYGSASGFDSLEEAYGDLAPQIFGIETGLSSDPAMNWQVPELSTRSILSFSDAHSAPKMGREATVVDLESLSYTNIRKAFARPSVIARNEAIATKESSVRIASSSATPRNDKYPNKIAYTLEFYPEEGKYHFSGHRNCKVVQGPEHIHANGNICPVCSRRMTEGVLFRVQQLADGKLLHRTEAKLRPDGLKWYTDTTHVQPPYVKLVPLLEIIAESLGSSVNSQKSKNLYATLCSELGSELQVLLHASVTDIERVGGGKVAQAVTKVRAGTISIEPGYDGVYGKVSIWNKGKDVPQLRLEI
ncbi:MAG: DNA helicase UvrD [Candidatus Levybacteria bacterium]|nr:DNA helicase UvrD [Candidatus Levybacteria bacterium]